MSTECQCGSLFLPIGSKYDSKGLFLRLSYNDTYVDLKLTHNDNCFLTNQEIFVSTTESININEIIDIKNCIIYWNKSYNISIFNNINIVIKDFNNKVTLFSKSIGLAGDITNPNNSIIQNSSAILVDNIYTNSSQNLFNNKLQLEIYSLCDFFEENICCDSGTQPTLSLSNTLTSIDLPCCPTSPQLGACCENGIEWNSSISKWQSYSKCIGVMPSSICNPTNNFGLQRTWLSGIDCSVCFPLSFCSSFIFPSSFPISIIGVGNFDGQEINTTVYKDNNHYSTSGTFPCGSYFFLEMNCDELLEQFTYDGEISCCDQSTKIVNDPTNYPLLYPNSRTPIFIDYTNCNDCYDCVSATTTTTVAPPDLPCDDSLFGPLTINGYAFYRKQNKSVNIPGIGDMNIQCIGGHCCNSTNFLPQLILESITLDGQPFNVNNRSDCGDRSATFSFILPSITLLENGARFKLQCLDTPCHNNITAVILTCEINGATKLLFNGCVLPNKIDPIILCPPKTKITYLDIDSLFYEQIDNRITQTYLTIDILCSDNN